MNKKKDVQDTPPQTLDRVMDQDAAKTTIERKRREYDSDVALTRAAAMGDHAARRDLVSRLLDSVRRTVTYLMGADMDSEDLAQVALIHILRSAGAFRGDCTLEYWADRIAVRTAMKHINKRRRRENLSAGVWEPPADYLSVDDQTSRRRVRIRLAELLQKLSPERRTAVALHHVQGYDLAEISEMTGSPVNTVRDRLRVGRKQLKKYILRDPMLKDWVAKGGEPWQ